MADVLIRGEDTETQERRPHGNGGRDWRDVTTS